MRVVVLLFAGFVLMHSVGCASSEPAVEGLVFYPRQALTRTFSYSRVAPDGSTLLGTITFGIQPQEVGASSGAEALVLVPGQPVETRVTFVAGGVAFSPQQAQLMHPMIDWPSTAQKYPLGVPDLQEDFAYHAVVGRNPTAGAPVSPTDAAMFWAQGVFTYLGMPRAPTAFITTSIAYPGDPDALCIRGNFKRDSQRLGSFVFTLRKNHGLSSVSATLNDGTTIALIERFSHPLDEQDPQDDAQRQEPLFARLDY